MKIRVGTATEKKKAELFNKSDILIQQGEFQKAIEDLNYLLRTDPSIRTQVLKKLAYTYLKMKEPMTSMAYIRDLIPSNDFFINTIVIQNLLLLKRAKEALMFLARSELTLIDKEKLLSLIYEHYPCNWEQTSKQSNLQSPIYLNCPYCDNPMFFLNGKLLCLKCRK
ncbi:MAG: hypothetical protein ACTSW1_15810 [Candidatus Hodarchaeales archaeon]